MPQPVSARLRSLAGDRGLQAGYAALAALVVADLMTGVLLTATYSASAIVASMLTSARRTALVAVSCVVLAYLLGYLRDEGSGLEWVLRASLGTGLGVLAVVSANVRDKREERLRRMTIIAATAQQALLSSLPSSVGDLDLAARYVSATAAAQVGGDLYEVTSTPYGVRLIVGDVRGKGLEAVQVAATVLSAFRHAAVSEPDLADLARGMDGVLRRLIGDEDFVTAVVAEVGPGGLTLVNCGHPAPLLLVGSSVTALEAAQPSPPLGLGADPEPSTHPWPPGARLLLFTDGLVEARDRRGRFFPLAEHAPALASGDLEEALDRLVGALRAHADDHLGDDLALVLAERRA